MSDEARPKPPKAYKNLDFLNSQDARSIRILCELFEPAQRFRQEGINHTIVFFGSARTPDTTTAAKRLREAEEFAADHPNDAAAEARLAVARAQHRTAPFHDAGRELARQLAEWSNRIPEPAKRFTICTGGGPGMMEAANEGSSMAGARSIGLGISLPFEPELNSYIPPELQFEFHYFFVRKYWFSYLMKAMVVLPGGFGTMDELFEVITLLQTHKIKKEVPIILFGKAFWTDILNFRAFVDWGMVAPEDLEMFHLVDEIDEARNIITEKLTTLYLTAL